MMIMMVTGGDYGNEKEQKQVSILQIYNPREDGAQFGSIPER